jgi:hypothetical protein
VGYGVRLLDPDFLFAHTGLLLIKTPRGGDRTYGSFYNRRSSGKGLTNPRRHFDKLDLNPDRVSGFDSFILSAVSVRVSKKEGKKGRFTFFGIGKGVGSLCATNATIAVRMEAMLHQR